MKSTSFINLFVKQNNMEHFTEKTMILKGCNMTNPLQAEKWFQAEKTTAAKAVELKFS